MEENDCNTIIKELDKANKTLETKQILAAGKQCDPPKLVECYLEDSMIKSFLKKECFEMDNRTPGGEQTKNIPIEKVTETFKPIKKDATFPDFALVEDNFVENAFDKPILKRELLKLDIKFPKYGKGTAKHDKMTTGETTRVDNKVKKTPLSPKKNDLAEADLLESKRFWFSGGENKNEATKTKHEMEKSEAEVIRETDEFYEKMGLGKEHLLPGVTFGLPKLVQTNKNDELTSRIKAFPMKLMVDRFKIFNEDLRHAQKKDDRKGSYCRTWNYIVEEDLNKICEKVQSQSVAGPSMLLKKGTKKLSTLPKKETAHRKPYKLSVKTKHSPLRQLKRRGSKSDDQFQRLRVMKNQEKERFLRLLNLKRVDKNGLKEHKEAERDSEKSTKTNNRPM